MQCENTLSSWSRPYKHQGLYLSFRKKKKIFNNKPFLQISIHIRFCLFSSLYLSISHDCGSSNILWVFLHQKNEANYLSTEPYCLNCSVSVSEGGETWLVHVAVRLAARPDLSLDVRCWVSTHWSPLEWLLHCVPEFRMIVAFFPLFIAALNANRKVCRPEQWDKVTSICKCVVSGINAVPVLFNWMVLGLWLQLW